MSMLLSRKFRLISFAVLITGVIAVSAAYAKKYVSRARPTTGYIIHSKQTLTIAGDSRTPLVKATSVRYQKANGAWKTVSTLYNPDGTVRRIDRGFAQPGRGVFQVDETNKRLKFLSQRGDWLPEYTEASLRSSPQFVREEAVLGYQTYVLRLLPEEGDDGYSEEYFAPGFATAIKRVNVSGNATQVTEPTKIEMREPPDSEFTSLPDYPIDYEVFEKKIQATEKAGKREVANQMRQTLQEYKSKESQQ